MDRDGYLNYIGWYVKGQSTDAKIFHSIFKKRLGSEFFEASVSKLKQLAYILYKSIALSRMTCIDSVLLTKLSSQQLTDAIEAHKEVREEFGLGIPQDTEIDAKTIDKEIKRLSERESGVGLGPLLDKIQNYGSKETGTKRTVKKKTEKTIKKTTKSPTAPVKKKDPAKKNYTVPELKEKAKNKGLKGYSKMKKDELKKLLKIK